MKASPLDEFIARSHARGQCDEYGVATGFPVPWAFTLATPGPTPDSPPSCRNIGIHHVDSDGFVFACRGHPGGAAGGGSLASICFLAGNYPNAGFEEQWRAEGIIQPLDVSEAMPMNADQDLQVQIVASSAFSEARRTESGSSDPVDTTGQSTKKAMHREGIPKGCTQIDSKLPGPLQPADHGGAGHPPPALPASRDL